MVKYMETCISLGVFCVATDDPQTLDENAAPFVPRHDYVQQLGTREHVRLRPGMYIGGTDSRAIYHLLLTVFQAFYEEIIAGHCTALEVTLGLGDWVTVTAVGAKLPDTPDGLPDLETTFIGHRHNLYGVGLSTVNFLSRAAWAEVCVDGYRYRQAYREGVPVEDVRRVGITSGLATGITFAYQPDPVIFPSTHLQFFRIDYITWHYAALFPGLRLTFINERRSWLRKDIVAPRGVYDYLCHFHIPTDAVSPVYYSAHTEQDHGPWTGRVVVGAAVVFQKETIETVYTLLPTGITTAQGTHNTAMTRRMLIRSPHLWPKNAYGFVAVMRVLHPQLQLEGGTINPRVRNPDLKPFSVDLVQTGLVPV